ncbi:MAG: NVEALA domain-containing protein [Bacteroidaceae bacterium]|nr:NVEALA domain-containing protein [Bacteroidaceae bacterium]
MKKVILKSTLVVVTATLTGICGVKAYEKYQTSKLAENTLLMQNIEALTGDEGNGMVSIIDPLTTRTCYTAAVDPNDYHIEQYYDEESGETYEIRKYRHYYVTYQAYKCKYVSYDEVLWHPLCPPTEHCETCQPGDYTSQPIPSEWYD